MQSLLGGRLRVNPMESLLRGVLRKTQQYLLFYTLAHRSKQSKMQWAYLNRASQAEVPTLLSPACPRRAHPPGRGSALSGAGPKQRIGS